MGSGKSSDRIQIISTHPQVEIDKNLAEKSPNPDNQLSKFARPADRNPLKKLSKTGFPDNTRIQEMS